MKCNHCGSELVKLPFDLNDAQVADLQLALDKTATAQTALQPDVFAGYRFDDDKDIYAYFKAVFDVMAEGRFLYALWEREVRKTYNRLEGEILVINGSCYAHKEG